MTTIRSCLLALSAVLWLGCSDAPTNPSPDPDETFDVSTLPTSLPADVIQELQAETAGDIGDLRDAITDLPRNVVHSEGNRRAMLARLNNIEREIGRGNIAQAVHHLKNLRRWVDGCADEDDKPHGNDKLTDCEAQMEIRAHIDDVIDSLLDVLDDAPIVTVTINSSVGQPDPASGGPVSFAVTFSAPVTGFTASDVSFAGSTAGGTLAALVSGSGAEYTVAVSGMTTNGTVVASIPAAAALDAANQPNAASTTTDNSVQFTAGSPTVTINQAAGQTDPSSAASITFTVQFSEPVTGFTAGDIAFTGSTATGTLVAVVSGSGPLYTVTVTGMTASGTVVVTIPAAAATDSDANPSAVSTSTDNTVSWIKP